MKRENISDTHIFLCEWPRLIEVETADGMLVTDHGGAYVKPHDILADRPGRWWPVWFVRRVMRRDGFTADPGALETAAVREYRLEFMDRNGARIRYKEVVS